MTPSAHRPGPIAALGTLLSVWAHPDDETYLAGGVMAAAIDAGQRVVCLSMTAGERGTADPSTWPPERLGRVRRWEHAASMAVLGVTEHEVGSWPDGGLASVHPSSPVAQLVEVIERVRPDTILTFGPDGMTFHSDHRAVSGWVGQAWRRTGCVSRLLHAALNAEHFARFADRYEEWGVYMTDERPVPRQPQELAVDLVLTGGALDRKLVALDAMASQTRPAVDLLGRHAYAEDVARECFVECRP